jgi:ApaG protein
MSDDEKYNIHVAVANAFVPEQSDPERNRYVFAYTITLRNDGELAAQLLNRHWIITHGNGKTEEVRGEGVVGEQPLLQPGESYEYTSGTILETPVGDMRGSYQMRAEDGVEFEAVIPQFSLSLPHTLH